MRSCRPLAVLALLAAVPALADPPATPALPTCSKSTPVAAAATGDLTARRAAQKGLQYLAKSSAQWTQQHGCFGCHVQAVTMEALAVGKHHQYDVTPKDLEVMTQALLKGVTAGGRTTG